MNLDPGGESEIRSERDSQLVGIGAGNGIFTDRIERQIEIASAKTAIGCDILPVAVGHDDHRRTLHGRRIGRRLISAEEILSLDIIVDFDQAVAFSMTHATIQRRQRHGIRRVARISDREHALVASFEHVDVIRA